MHAEKLKEPEWTEIITPKAHVLDIKFKEIWRYRDLLVLFVKRDFAAQYRQTILGPLWHVVQPVLTTLMFFILFTRIARIPTDNLPPAIFYMSGIAIWNYFSSCFTGTSNTFITNAGIFGKVYFPRLIIPLSIVSSNIVRFGIQMLLLIATMVYYAAIGSYQIHIGWHLLLIPVVVSIMAMLGLGAGIIISSLTTKYRDLAVLIGFGVQLLMYITPVAYPMSYIGNSRYKTLIYLNPLSSLVEAFRYAVLGTGSFNNLFFLYSCICTVVILVGGMIVFSKVERTFMDTV